MFKPSLRNLKHLSEHLREADKIEVKALTGLDTLPALKQSVNNSIVSYVDKKDDPDVIFGISEYPEPRHHAIWLVGTPEIEKQSLRFCRTSKAFIKGFFEESKTTDFLCNFTHADNVVHHRWLEWLGAQLGPAVPYGPFGELFRPFILKRK